MSVASRFRNSSKRLIDRYGRYRDYVHITEQEYDFETQTMKGGEITFTIKMFKSEPKWKEVNSPNLVDRAVVVMMVSAIDLPVIPKINDFIKDSYLGEDEAYQVVQIKANEAGDEVATWRLICIKN